MSCTNASFVERILIHFHWTNCKTTWRHLRRRLQHKTSMLNCTRDVSFNISLKKIDGSCSSQNQQNVIRIVRRAKDINQMNESPAKHHAGMSSEYPPPPNFNPVASPFKFPDIIITPSGQMADNSSACNIPRWGHPIQDCRTKSTHAQPSPCISGCQEYPGA